MSAVGVRSKHEAALITIYDVLSREQVRVGTAGGMAAIIEAMARTDKVIRA